MSIDLAKRPDVREVVLAVAWELVVVDEAHALSGQRFQLVEALVEKENPPSVLLATHVEDKGVLALAERGALLIDWSESVAEFRSRQEKGTDARLARVIRAYRPTNGEVAVAAGVVDLARKLGKLKGMALIQRAASSISSLEDSLVRWAEDPEDGLEHLESIEELLQRVEQLRVDSRLDCFKSLVEELVGAGVRHVVTFCQYRATLDYLAAAVERLDFAGFGIHAGMAHEQRRESVSRFRKEGGLLITTAAASEGLSLNFVGAAVHYDLPMSPVAFEQREGRYNRYGRDLPCTIYFFEDETGALFESLLLRMVRKPDLVTGKMDVDFDGVFQVVVE